MTFRPGQTHSLRITIALIQNMVNLIELINTQIQVVTQGLTASVTAVTDALAMHVNEMADAYSGRCPDHSKDVNPLDLDSNYIILLDDLRRNRPDSYSLLTSVVEAWQKNPPVLYKQPAVMSEVVEILAKRLGSSGSCPPEVAAAVSASMSTATHRPPDPETDTGSADAGEETME